VVGRAVPDTVVNPVIVLVKGSKPLVRNEVENGVGTMTSMTLAPDTTVVTVKGAAVGTVPDVTVMVGSTVCMPTSTYVDATPPTVVVARLV
jgi:hypothetical protein